MKSSLRLWRWAEVISWLNASGNDDTAAQVDKARMIAAINGAPELRRHAPDESKHLLRSLCS